MHFGRHVVRVALRKAARLSEIVAAGESPAALLIMVGATLVFIAPVVAILIALDFGLADLFS